MAGEDDNAGGKRKGCLCTGLDGKGATPYMGQKVQDGEGRGPGARAGGGEDSEEEDPDGGLRKREIGVRKTDDQAKLNEERHKGRKRPLMRRMVKVTPAAKARRPDWRSRGSACCGLTLGCSTSNDLLLNSS